MLALLLAVVLQIASNSEAVFINGTEMTMDQAIMAASISSRIFQLMDDTDTDTVRVEMDMLFKTKVWEEIMRQRSGSRRSARKAIRDSRFRWPDGIIPYQIAVSLTQSEYQQFQAAIADYHRYTCVRFRPVQSFDKNYIQVVSGGGCSSYVGMQGGSQIVSLAGGCRVKGVIIHELGHAIGFNHEQTRSDRDAYVRINTNNISPSMAFNFQKYTNVETNNYEIPYDYLSVMHYGEYAFSNNGQPTIVTKDSQYQKRIGNRVGFSFKDIKLANFVYECAARARCPPKSCSGDGFVGPDCQCWCESEDEAAPTRSCSGFPITSSSTSGTLKLRTHIIPTSCVDNSTNCRAWSKQGYCVDGRYRAYMAIHCKATCNACSAPLVTTVSTAKPATEATTTTTRTTILTTTPTTTTVAATTKALPSRCSDENQMCDVWARIGECEANPRYMRKHCAESCRSCDDESNKRGCVDHGAHCTYWTSQGHCNSPLYGLYMGDNCQRSCRHCQPTAPVLSQISNVPTTTTTQQAKPDPCQDSGLLCSHFKRRHLCASLGDQCRKTCGLCRRA